MTLWSEAPLQLSVLQVHTPVSQPSIVPERNPVSGTLVRRRNIFAMPGTQQNVHIVFVHDVVVHIAWNALLGCTHYMGDFKSTSDGISEFSLLH